MTMKELGRKVGVTESAISHYEAGRRVPNLNMLLQLSKALGCSVDSLVAGDSLMEQYVDDKYWELYRTLPDEARKKVCDLIDRLV